MFSRPQQKKIYENALKLTKKKNAEYHDIKITGNIENIIRKRHLERLGIF